MLWVSAAAAATLVANTFGVSSYSNCHWSGSVVGGCASGPVAG